MSEQKFAVAFSTMCKAIDNCEVCPLRATLIERNGYAYPSLCIELISEKKYRKMVKKWYKEHRGDSI
ncbi:MAG: hypothetical protein RR614_07410 [Eubacterium sp.]